MNEDQVKGLEKSKEQVVDPNRIPFDDSAPKVTLGHLEGNSNKAKARVKPVAKGRVRRKRRSKLSESFIAEDANDVIGYILNDVLLPAAKSTLSDMVSSGIERLLFGGETHYKRPGNTPTRRSSSMVSYGDYYRSGRSESIRRKNPPGRTQTRQTYSEVVIGSRPQAQEVLSNLLELIASYGTASLADFYELVGLPSTYVDLKHGWDDLRDASITRVRDGYIINLPRPVPLN